MTDSDIDCRKIWESIEADTEKLLSKDISENLITDLKDTIIKRIEDLHKQIDEKKEQFVNDVITSFTKKNEEPNEKDAKSGANTVKGDAKKKNSKKKEKDIKKEIEIFESEVTKNYTSKIEELYEALDKVLNSAALVEKSTDFFNTTPIDKLLFTSKEEVKIKIPYSIGKLLSNKPCFDIEWDPNNNPSYSDIDKNDPTILNIHGTTCYTYYKTLKEFCSEESFTIELEYKIVGSDDYFYLGLINELVVPTSHCMCCTIANGFYLQPTSGDVISNAKRENKPKLKGNKNVQQALIIRYDGSDKNLYFTLNDNEEVGPFKVNGNKLRFVSGSCNSKTGYVKILQSYY